MNNFNLIGNKFPEFNLFPQFQGQIASPLQNKNLTGKWSLFFIWSPLLETNFTEELIYLEGEFRRFKLQNQMFFGILNSEHKRLNIELQEAMLRTEIEPAQFRFMNRIDQELLEQLNLPIQMNGQNLSSIYLVDPYGQISWNFSFFGSMKGQIELAELQMKLYKLLRGPSIYWDYHDFTPELA